MLDYPLSTNSIATLTKWESLVDLLKCQNCGSYRLQIQTSELVCASCHATYPLLGGAAIFRTPVESVEVFPVEHVSNQVSSPILDWLSSLNGYSLNIGAGGTLAKIPHCVEMEYSVLCISIFRRTDSQTAITNDTSGTESVLV